MPAAGPSGHADALSCSTNLIASQQQSPSSTVSPRSSVRLCRMGTDEDDLYSNSSLPLALGQF